MTISSDVLPTFSETWQPVAVSNGVTQSIDALVVNAGLIRKVYFPREGLVLSFVGSQLVTFLIEMGVVLTVLAAYGNNIFPWIPVLLLLMAVEA